MPAPSWRLPLLPALLLTLGALVVGCGRPGPPGAPPGPPWFADVTAEVGLNFTHDAGPADIYFMPQIIGSGAAAFDFDGDGLLDVYLLQNGGPRGAKNQLFRQLPGGKFQNVSEGSGLDVAGNNMGVAVGDVNNDGRPDVLLTQYRGVRLFRNDGGGKFTDITREAGLDNPLWAASASFLDYDRDGWLDLVVVNYVKYDPARDCTNEQGEPDFCGPNHFDGTVTRLFHHKGGPAGSPARTVRFEDVTESSGLSRAPGPGLGVFCADFDGDGWPDIFVVNDGKPNHLWVNHHNGTFKEEAMLRGLAYNEMGQSQAGMGVAVGDVDGDGLFDVFVTHLTEETNTLWRQGPRGRFHDETRAAGLIEATTRGTGFGTVLADFDHDGRPDLAVVNGRVYAGPPAGSGLGPFWDRFAERNRLWAGAGEGRFRDVSAANAAFCGTPAVSRGLAYGDFNGDGAIDLLVTTVAGPARLFRNVAPDRGHYLLVRAIDPRLRRDAVGAEITVRAGGRRWVGVVQPGSSFLCSNDPRVHFGLGAVDRVDSVEVKWPDGLRETFREGLAVDRPVKLTRGGEGKR